MGVNAKSECSPATDAADKVSLQIHVQIRIHVEDDKKLAPRFSLSKMVLVYFLLLSDCGGYDAKLV